MAGTGFLALVPSLWACVVTGLWALFVFDCLIYAWILAVAFLPSVSYTVKLVSLIAVGLGLGGAVMAFAGADGAGYLWLVFAVLVAALLGRRVLTLATFAASLAIILLYALASALGRAPKPQLPSAVLVIAANLVIIFAVLVYVIRRLLRGLELSLAESQEATKTLEMELRKNEGLLRELNHRVRNNMQLSLSLVGIEAASGQGSREEGLGTVERRLRALAITNELIIDHSDFERIELRDLARLLAFAEPGQATEGPGSRRLWTLGDFSWPLNAGQAIVLGIAIAEIIHALAGPEGGGIDIEDRGQGPLLVFRPGPGPVIEAGPGLEGLRALLPPGSLGQEGAKDGRASEISLALQALPS